MYMSTDKIEQQITINAPVERVWKALTSAEGLQKWYAFGGAKIDLRAGGNLSFQWDEHGEYPGIVETVEPQKRFAFRFAPFTPDTPPEPGNATVVDITLSPTNDTTLVQLTESGYNSLNLPQEETAQNYETSKGAWADSLELLKKLSEE